MGNFWSPLGYKYIMVMCDSFTKWEELRLLRTKTAEEVAETFLSAWILRHGYPRGIVTDQGLEFNNRIMNEVGRKFEIEHIRTTPYNPKANGQCERANRTIIGYMQALTQDQPDDWAEWLEVVQLAYNSNIHSSTEYTPFFAVYGREMELPNTLRNNYVDESPEANHHRIQRTWNIIRRNLLKASAQYKVLLGI